jgi:hypothetical protein
MTRSCGTCTKCCEGWLSGDAYSHPFYPGRPCHFLAIGKGCSIYKTRPEEPCKTYQCSWIKDMNIPEWMKPEDISAIVDEREINGIPYFNIVEAGKILDVKALTWLIDYCSENNKNLCYRVEVIEHYLGSPEFVQAMKNNKGK